MGILRLLDQIDKRGMAKSKRPELILLQEIFTEKWAILESLTKKMGKGKEISIMLKKKKGGKERKERKINGEGTFLMKQLWCGWWFDLG